jgi:hypothetical protein
MAPRSLWMPPPTPVPREVRQRLWWAGAAAVLLPWLAGVWFQPGLSADPERALLMVDILVVASILFLVTMVFTVTIGCWIVAVMKGPQYLADPFPDPEIR